MGGLAQPLRLQSAVAASTSIAVIRIAKSLAGSKFRRGSAHHEVTSAPVALGVVAWPDRDRKLFEIIAEEQVDLDAIKVRQSSIVPFVSIILGRTRKRRKLVDIARSDIDHEDR